MRIKGDEDHAPEVDLAPMIDCVFLLLIFFLITAKLKTTDHQVKFEQPSGAVELTETAPAERLILRMTPHGKISWKGGKFALKKEKDTAKAIKKIASVGVNRPVEIRADPRTESGTILKLLDLLKLAGFKQIHIAVFSDIDREKKP